ncbi:putative nuclease HARBI1 [Leptopilina heterotoma]|uniref:putative nuclease HARBI1 n=1 Tax=Leptopilina heterotoma TaxID=63436 RepID=UPI001CA846BD|nr:putative nuclease HARBI1 [Leptopilina heterotoma]
MVLEDFDDIEFKRNFRVSKGIFSKLEEIYENSNNVSTNNHGLPCTSTESQILQFLWFAGNKSVIRDVASRFDVAESTCHLIINNIIDFLNDISSQVIKFPKTEEEKAAIAEKFQEIAGFPGIIGAINGSYITIRTPAHKVKSTYVNRHDQTALTLQGVSGKVHVSSLFKMSFIYNEIRTICGENWHLIGDAAYGIKKWLLVPYRDYGNLSEEEKKKY